ncbi:MAG: hypothetical protein E7541_01825 [Ruminococcaceae bacterium]|nr:hypothetical protein [Oscillospiraceae bacterium]
MNRIFDITDFGAVGDGQTDCTAAIQAAMDAASQAGGGVIEVPPGIYSTGMVHMKTPLLTLHGHFGWGYRTTGLSVLKLNDPEAECLLDITGAYGCTVDGISLIGERLGQNVHGIRLDWDKHYREKRSQEDTPILTHVRIAHFSGDGIHYNKVWAYKVEHCMLNHNDGAGLFYNGCDAFVSDTIMIGNKGGGIDGYGKNSSGCTFTSNRIEWNDVGGLRLRRNTRVNITGNYFDRNFGPGLELGGPAEDSCYANITVTGNVFCRNGAISEGRTTALDDPDMCCHLRMTHCRNAVVSGNTYETGKNDGGSGELTPNRAILMEDCSYCVVKDNVMDHGYIVTGIEQRGDCTTCIVKDNPGRPME